MKHLHTDKPFTVRDWIFFMNRSDAFDVVASTSGGWFMLACSDGVLWFNQGQWEAVMEYWHAVPELDVISFEDDF